MVYRHIAQPFCHQRTKRSSVKLIINELPKTFNDKVYPRIPFLVRSKRTKISVVATPYLENNPSTQLENQARWVTSLIRDERIMTNYNKIVAIRPQVERLIVEAMRYGDTHRPTMALADFWLKDKSMIHKLFKELVPRYQSYSTAFTAVHRLGLDYDQLSQTMTERKDNMGKMYHRKGDAILELRGNNLPPVYRPQLNKSALLTNILIAGGRLESNKVLTDEINK